MKPEDEWGPADMLANGVMEGVAWGFVLLGAIAMIAAIYLIFLWLLS